MTSCPGSLLVAPERTAGDDLPARRDPLTETAPRLRILHLMQCTNLGGMERAACEVMRELKSGGRFEFRIGTPRALGPGSRVIRQFDSEATAFDCRGRFGWHGRHDFRAWVRQESDSSSLIWVTGTCAASLAAIHGCRRPKVLSHHHHHFEARGSWLRWRAFYELLCRQLDAVVYPTEFTRAEAIAIAPWLEPRTTVIRNGVEPCRLDEVDLGARRREARRHLGLPQETLVVGNGGWFVGRKRFDIFLEVAARVRARRPDSLFVLCGGGPDEPQLRQKVADLGLAEAVRFEGWVDSMKPYYEAFNILLFNSDYDAFGRMPLEAANCGALVVASVRYGGLCEFIDHGINGVLLGEHDREALAEAVLELADSPRAADMRARACRTIQDRYSTASAAAASQNLFERLSPGADVVRLRP